MPDKRVETGVVQFGDDWPGVFIRGDHAFSWLQDLKAVLEKAAPTERSGAFYEYQYDSVASLAFLLADSNMQMIREEPERIEVRYLPAPPPKEN